MGRRAAYTSRDTEPRVKNINSIADLFIIQVAVFGIRRI